MGEIGTNLELAADLLRAGKLVAFGTETVYGLGADATNETAVAAVFAAKERPSFDPLIVHLSDAAEADLVASEWSKTAELLASQFWPGPLTIVVPKRERIGDLVTSGLPAVGLRVPGLRQTRDLIRSAGRPIAAPSANRFGMVSPTTAQHVADQLGDRLAYIFDTGPAGVGVESTVVRVERDDVVVLRPGGVTVEHLAAVCRGVRMADDSERGEMIAQDSPGRLPKHYAPGVPLLIGRPGQSTPNDGLLAFGRSAGDWAGPVEMLSESGDCEEAARHLFAAMRRLASLGVQQIFTDVIPNEGLGRAINDRLRRAAAS